MLKNVKIFGERNTGTNLLQGIFENHTSLSVLSHRGIVKNAKNIVSQKLGDQLAITQEKIDCTA